MTADIKSLRELSQQIDDLYGNGDDSAAEELLRRTLDESKEIDPVYHVFFQSEWAGYVEKDRDKQHGLIKQAVESRPEDSLLARNMGVSVSRLGREEEALEWFDKALEINPEDFHAMRLRGVSLDKLGRGEEALEWFDKALEINPIDSNSLRQRGVALDWLKRSEEALEWHEKALEVNPSDYRAMCEKGLTLIKLGRFETALEWCGKAVKRNPKDSRAKLISGISTMKLGRVEEANVWFGEAVELNPDDGANIHWKARGLFEAGRYDEALEAAARAMELKRDDSNAISLYNLIAHKLSAERRKIEPSEEPDSEATASRRGLEDKLGTASAEPVRQWLLTEVIRHIHQTMAKEKDGLLEKMRETEARRLKFLAPRSDINPDETLFLVMRKWNSFTPIIPDSEGERHVGGGYFVFDRGRGTVIDPGYNFIENFWEAGFNVHDIHNIVVTHAHNDHTADLESLLTLIYEYNDAATKAAEEAAKAAAKGAAGKDGVEPAPVDLKHVRLFLNTGAFKKFSGFLDLRGAKYIDRVDTLMSGHDYDLGNGLKLTALRAYHEEIVAKNYAVGVQLTFKDGDETRRVTITSDTCLLPPDSTGDQVDEEGEEIWKTYPKVDRLDLLITHLGSIKEQEFTELETEEGDTPPTVGFGKLIYKNHLGIIGTVRVICSLEPDLALVSEFGEELATVQVPLMEMIRKIVEVYCEETAPRRIPVLPADLPFIYRVWDRTAYCIFSKEFVPAIELLSCEPKEKTRRFYYAKKSTSDPQLLVKASDFAEDFEESRRSREPGTIYFAP